MRTIAKALVLCATLWALTAAEAMACSCVAPGDERKTYRMADAAFVGKLVSVTPSPRGPGDAPRPTSDTSRFRYEIVKRYKRALGRRFVTVHAGTQGASCGLPTQTGKRYAMYLDRAHGRWSSSLCSMTTARALKDAAAGRSSPGLARFSLACLRPR